MEAMILDGRPCCGADAYGACTHRRTLVSRPPFAASPNNRWRWSSGRSAAAALIAMSLLGAACGAIREREPGISGSAGSATSEPVAGDSVASESADGEPGDSVAGAPGDSGESAGGESVAGAPGDSGESAGGGSVAGAPGDSGESAGGGSGESVADDSGESADGESVASEPVAGRSDESVAGESDAVPVEGLVEVSIIEESDDGEPVTVWETSFVINYELLGVTERECPMHLSGMGLRCVLVTVPANRANPAVKTQVSVAIRPGTGDESLAPLAVLQGGPGGASSDLAPLLPSRPYAQVLIDQRGVGFGTDGFWCEELHDSLVEMIEADRDEAKAIASNAQTRCSDRLKTNPVFANTTTVAHAADVVDVMEALGYERWLLYGVSYGSTIALEVLRDPPAALAGAVLDGVFPGRLDFDAAAAAGVDRVIREFDAECSVDPACTAILAEAGGGETTSLSELLAELIPRRNASPIAVSLAPTETTMDEPLDALIDGDSVAAAVFLMLYSEFTAPLVPGLVAGLAQDDDTANRLVAALGVEAASLQAHSGTLATNAAVACAEFLPDATGPPPDMSNFAAAVVGGGLADRCAPWAVAASPLPPEPVASDLPVLLISGWFDPITPPSFAEEVAAHLPAATHIVSRTRGHGIWAQGYDNCVDRIVADFLAEPGAELDTACALEDRPLRWQPLP